MAEFDKAFVSPDIVRVDDKLYKSVVMAKRFPGNELSIAIYPFGLPSTLGNLMVLINQDDLAEVQKLLGEERSVLPMAWEDDLALARRALEDIYTTPVQVPGTMEAWRILALHCKGIAASALGKLMDAEADDGTPSDS